MKLKRIYHHCDKLEEGPMWRTEAGPEKVHFVREASRLMQDTPAFKAAMHQATIDWPFSCEHNLTAASVNKLAWLGHAGCYLRTGSPELCTRTGWHTLNQDQQDAANQAAQEVLDDWTRRHLAGNGRLPEVRGVRPTVTIHQDHPKSGTLPLPGL